MSSAVSVMWAPLLRVAITPLLSASSELVLVRSNCRLPWATRTAWSLAGLALALRITSVRQAAAPAAALVSQLTELSQRLVQLGSLVLV